MMVLQVSKNTKTMKSAATVEYSESHSAMVIELIMRQYVQ